jgi:peptidoglycan/LPS O-acetylase OafA/YrhL
MITSMRAQPVGHLAPLEALRGVAAWSIVTFHVWLFTSAATLTWNLGPATVFMRPLQSGVTLFFVLSGFLLYRPFAQAALSGSARPSIRRYLRNRALRILPAYWTVLLVSFAAGATVVATAGNGHHVGRLGLEQLSASLILVQGYRPSTIFTGLQPAWSLGVEAAFYVVLPLVAVVASARQRRSVWLPPALLLAGGFLSKAAFAAAGIGAPRTLSASWASVAGQSLLAHADLFGFGMVAAVVFARWENSGAPPWISSATVGRLLAYLGLPCAVLGFYFLSPFIYKSVVAFFCALLVLRVAASALDVRSGPRRALLESRLASASGRISYSVFLWNYPLLTFLAVHRLLMPGHGAASFVGNLAVAVTVVSLLSVLSYRFVEKPALKLKRAAPSPGQRVETGWPPRGVEVPASIILTMNQSQLKST